MGFVRWNPDAIAGGGLIIDTPGMRTLQVSDAAVGLIRSPALNVTIGSRGAVPRWVRRRARQARRMPVDHYR